MKIPGSFFETNLVLINNQNVELQILKRGEVKHRATIMDFSEIEFDLRDVLEENGIYLPKKRLDFIMQQLEADFLDIQERIENLQTKQRQVQRATKQKLSGIPNKEGIPHKVLLLGGSGKTSIFKVIFEGLLPYKTQILEPTLQDVRHIIDFPSYGFRSSKEKLNLWETGQYFPEEAAFHETALILFIIDAFDIENYEKARINLHKAIKIFRKLGTKPGHLGPDQSNIFCFIHKMDRFPNSSEKFHHLTNFFNKDPENGQPDPKINFYPTSIFDSTIYTAWTKVIETLMPKSSKLNELANQLKEDLELYASFVIEKKNGLPICASKTLLEDSALVGNTNRLMITIEKVLSDFQLAKFESLRLKTATGFLELRLFKRDTYHFILMMLYPPNVDLSPPGNEKRIQDFINTMKSEI